MTICATKQSMFTCGPKAKRKSHNLTISSSGGVQALKLRQAILFQFYSSQYTKIYSKQFDDVLSKLIIFFTDKNCFLNNISSHII